MKILIDSHQLNLLASSFHIVEGHGLVLNGENLIQESKMPTYLVVMLVNGQPCAIRISGFTRSSVLSIARALFPKAKITGSATLIR